MNMAKPDNRKNNVERLQQMKDNTQHNIEAAEETLQSDLQEEQRKAIKEKNRRRAESIKAFDAEIADEMEARKSGYKNQ
ncbi:small acid-soluble spore protein Tlp [Halalkalibacter alkaliphilus]|uniref:Small, acid-soluble spore protein Tlp n=1 Tax=Halalkalibacter alkaliphilus TaxID=2917993 RepID=A0A9X2CRA1_9BACI|nr:small acid-soluble spore protein Tlp [Halalkalibacter alkaliphilus]MCL7745589.1 small acid-soluble spore protein Tlp [Halalkalibacter alkaliphilus]